MGINLEYFMFVFFFFVFCHVPSKVSGFQIEKKILDRSESCILLFMSLNAL